MRPEAGKYPVVAGEKGRAPSATGLPKAGRRRVELRLALPRVHERAVVAAPLAQSAERLHGKEKVYGSIP